MYIVKPSLRKPNQFVLVLIFLVACAPPVSATPALIGTNLPLTAQAGHPSMLTPTLLAERALGSLEDVAWSPSSKTFAVNYWMDNSNSNNIVEAFSVESIKPLWTAGNSVASSLVFTSDGQYIVESNTHVPLFYWRNTELGKIVRMGELTDMGQMEKIECVGGGQMMVANAKGNFALLADYNALMGLNGPNAVFIRRLDLETGKCKELFRYEGSFKLFDLNSDGTLLAYGGVGMDESVVIRDLEKQSEVCRTTKVEFGRFVPGGDMLAVVRDQRIIFINARTCEETRELGVSPSSGYESYFAFSPDGQEFAVARDSIQIMNVSKGEVLAQMPFPQNAGLISKGFFWSGIKFSPDGRILLTAYAIPEGNEIQLWQLKK